MMPDPLYLACGIALATALTYGLRAGGFFARRTPQSSSVLSVYEQRMPLGIVSILCVVVVSQNKPLGTGVIFSDQSAGDLSGQRVQCGEADVILVDAQPARVGCGSDGSGSDSILRLSSAGDGPVVSAIQ